MADFGIELAVQSPEAFGIEFELPARDLPGREIAIVQNPAEIGVR